MFLLRGCVLVVYFWGYSGFDRDFVNVWVLSCLEGKFEGFGVGVEFLGNL